MSELGIAFCQTFIIKEHVSGTSKAEHVSGMSKAQGSRDYVDTDA